MRAWPPEALIPRDRRAWLVEITPAGTVALDRVVAVKKALMNTLFDGLSDTDRERFADTLVGLRTTLDSTRKAAHVS